MVTYRSEAYIGNCLSTLCRELEVLGEEFLVVVIDNASGDETIAKIENMKLKMKKKGLFEIIQNQENVGFAKAANQGIRKCLDEECTEVLLINPDTEMEYNSLKYMVDRLRLDDTTFRRNSPRRVSTDADKGIGIVQPLITLMSEPGLVNTSGNVDRGMGFVSINGYRNKIQNITFKMKKEIDYASGACMMVRREVFEEVGLFDERFFLYFEDTEFSDRVRKAGWRICLVPEARVRHDYRPVRSLKKIGNVVKSWWRYCRLKK